MSLSALECPQISFTKIQRSSKKNITREVYCKDQIPPSTDTNAIKLMPSNALLSPTTERALLVLLSPVLVVPLGPGALLVGAAEGVNTAPGLAMHELAAESAVRLDDVFELTVPLPPN